MPERLPTVVPVGLNPVDRLSFQTSGLRDCRDRNSLTQEVLHQPELFQIEGRFPSPIFAAVIMRLGMSYPGFLRFLDHLGLALRGCRHEGNQGVANSLLHRVLRGTVKGQSIDDGSNNDPASNEFPDGVGHVGIVSP